MRLAANLDKTKQQFDCKAYATRGQLHLTHLSNSIRPVARGGAVGADAPPSQIAKRSTILRKRSLYLN